jgi:hypothetical protein
VNDDVTRPIGVDFKIFIGILGCDQGSGIIETKYKVTCGNRAVGSIEVNECACRRCRRLSAADGASESKRSVNNRVGEDEVV